MPAMTSLSVLPHPPFWPDEFFAPSEAGGGASSIMGAPFTCGSSPVVKPACDGSSPSAPLAPEQASAKS
jgi:hypothetical protein